MPKKWRGAWKVFANLRSAVARLAYSLAFRTSFLNATAWQATKQPQDSETLLSMESIHVTFGDSKIQCVRSETKPGAALSFLFPNARRRRQSAGGLRNDFA